MKELNTLDIYNEFIEKYQKQEFRIIGNDVQQSKTLEIQNAHFLVDKPWIVRKPNYDYFDRELQWYYSESLNVDDIPEETPKMWKACASPLGYINSNYGWCIFSKDNYYQYKHCMDKLLEDPHTREAIMIYNRPSMQEDYCKDGMHDFMCCQNVQYFINERDGKCYLDCIVNFRSNDAVFGFNNDALWELHVLEKLTNDLHPLWIKKYNQHLIQGRMWWNAGSLHIYERHFNQLFNEKNINDIKENYEKSSNSNS